MCIAEENCGNVWFAVLVYVVSDVMEKIAFSGTEEHTTHYYITMYFMMNLQLIFVNLWNGLLTQSCSVAQQMSVCSKFQHYKDM